MTAPVTTVRLATVDDAAAMADVLNAVIREGGRTAIEGPVSPADLRDWYLDGSTAYGCVIATRDDRWAVGFQALERHHGGLAADEADIATFVDARARGGGVGRALAEATFARMATVGLTGLRAVIRADNAPAIAYYRALGFDVREHSITLPGRVVLHR